MASSLAPLPRVSVCHRLDEDSCVYRQFQNATLLCTQGVPWLLCGLRPSTTTQMRTGGYVSEGGYFSYKIYNDSRGSRVRLQDAARESPLVPFSLESSQAFGGGVLRQG